MYYTLLLTSQNGMAKGISSQKHLHNYSVDKQQKQPPEVFYKKRSS